jgi:hypothetical protein
MAKDWRLAVCTRWRPLATIILVCLSLLSVATFADSVFTKVDEYPIRQLAKRIERIKVGMTIAELESILGPPDSTTDEVDRESLNLGEGGSSKIVEYRYSAWNRLRDARTEYDGVFVDKDTNRIVSIHLSRGWWSAVAFAFWEEWALLIAGGLMILVVLVVPLLFRAWCQSVTDVEGNE